MGGIFKKGVLRKKSFHYLATPWGKRDLSDGVTGWAWEADRKGLWEVYAEPWNAGVARVLPLPTWILAEVKT